VTSTLLITGAAGFIGSNFTNRFVAVLDASGATGPISNLVVLQLQP